MVDYIYSYAKSRSSSIQPAVYYVIEDTDSTSDEPRVIAETDNFQEAAKIANSLNATQ